MRVRHAVYVDRPSDEVFAFISNHANDALWRTELDSHEFVGEAREGVGLRMRQMVSYQGRSAELNLEVTDLTPGERICFRAHGGVRAHGCYEVKPDGFGTILEVAVTLELKGGQEMLERYLRQALESAVADDLGRLKTLLEGAPAEERR
jgi:uncharacterized membrane protein